MSVPKPSPPGTIQALSEWFASVEPLKAFVFTLFAGTFGLGVTYARLDARLEANASDLKAESKARESADDAVSHRIDRGFDKVLKRLDDVQGSLDRRSTADAQTAREIGLLRGLYQRNYGPIDGDGGTP